MTIADIDRMLSVSQISCREFCSQLYHHGNLVDGISISPIAQIKTLSSKSQE